MFVAFTLFIALIEIQLLMKIAAYRPPMLQSTPCGLRGKNRCYTIECDSIYKNPKKVFEKGP